MRITCEVTASGNVYHFYQTDDDFYGDLKRLIPYLLESDAPLEVGPSAKDMDVLLTAGPFAQASENEFRRRAKRHLED